jgi:AcrR family transcriptional regulator
VPKPDGLQLGADAIVEVATEILLEEGLDAVSMRSVSARLGVSPVPLYSRIGNKDDLLDAMSDHLLANLAPAVQLDEHWPDYATRWSVEIRRRLLVATDSRLILRERRHHYVEASRPLINLMRADGLSSDLAVQGCRQLIWAIVGFVALEGHQTRASGARSQRRRPGADPSGVTPEEVEELFSLQIRYLIEGIGRGSNAETAPSETTTSGGVTPPDTGEASKG